MYLVKLIDKVMKIIQNKSIIIFSDGTVNFCSNSQQVIFSEKDYKNFFINKKPDTYSKIKSNYLKEFRNKYS